MSIPCHELGHWLSSLFPSPSFNLIPGICPEVIKRHNARIDLVYTGGVLHKNHKPVVV